MFEERILGSLTVHKLTEEWASWRKDIRKLRFGQYIVNRHCKDCWADVFYEEDHDEAFRMCLEVLQNNAKPNTSEFAWDRRDRA